MQNSRADRSVARDFDGFETETGGSNAGRCCCSLTLLQTTTAWAQGTVCHRVWVEVRDNDLMGNSELTAPPRTRYPGTFCFIVHDRRTARFSLEPDDPSLKPFASLVLRRSKQDGRVAIS